MLILRSLLSIILAPIFAFLNLFKPKDNLLEWFLTYDNLFVQIRSKYQEQFIKDDLLIASYILFLNRYFYICDERQIEAVRSIIKQFLNQDHSNPQELASKIYHSIFTTLYPKEQKVVGLLFANGLPPLTYKQEGDWEPIDPYAKYTFLVYERKGKLTDSFHMSFGRDIILLPVTVGILYEYTSDHLEEKGNRQRLDKMITDLLEAHNHVDCRSIRTFTYLPQEVFLYNKITYK